MEVPEITVKLSIVEYNRLKAIETNYESEIKKKFSESIITRSGYRIHEGSYSRIEIQTNDKTIIDLVETAKNVEARSFKLQKDNDNLLNCHIYSLDKKIEFLEESLTKERNEKILVSNELNKIKAKKWWSL